MTTKTVFIELALCNIPRITRRNYKSSSYYEDQQHTRQYDILTWQVETPVLSDNVHPDEKCFINQLTDITDANYSMLNYVCQAIYNRWQEFPYMFAKYSLCKSYGYFAFTDENGKTVFSSPHETSPVLFDPNEEDSNYTLSSCLSTGDIFTGAFDNPCQPEIRIAKRNDLRVITYENTLEDDLLTKLEITSSPTLAINCLFNYLLMPGLKSFYSTKISTNIMLGDISTVSSFETKGFLYKPATK